MSGIYRILCLENNKAYVGQAVIIKNRIRDHKARLRNNKHCNIYLQNSWNKYGENSFTFETLELTSLEDLDTREQFWMDECKVFETGFNILPQAGSPKGVKRTEEQKANISLAKGICEYDFLSPKGEVIKVKNLTKFCRENNLPRKNMSAVWNKTQKSCNGWRHPDLFAGVFVPPIKSSRYIGVTKFKDRWIANIKIAGKSKNLGYYDTEQEAAIVRDKIAKELGRELNFKDQN